jgi:hypothetical protein
MSAELSYVVTPLLGKRTGDGWPGSHIAQLEFLSSDQSKKQESGSYLKIEMAR